MSKEFTDEEKDIIIDEAYEIGNRTLVAKKYGIDSTPIK